MKRSIASEENTITPKKNPPTIQKEQEKRDRAVEKNNRSGVVLKPLSKAEQSKILHADKKNKKEAIEQIRKENIKEKNQIDDIEQLSQNETQSDARENRKDIEKKKTAEIDTEFHEKKRPQNTFGRN